MTITIDPITLSTLAVVILTAISGFLWVGRLSSGVDRLEADVKELKAGQKEILQLLHQHIGFHQGLSDSTSSSSA